MKKNVLKILAIFCISTIMLVGCGTKGNSSNDKATEKTVTVKDVKGQVKIPAEPKRIVDLSGNSDILSILRYKVIGTANSDAYDYKKFPSYLEDTLKGAKILGYSMQSTMDTEAVMNLKPDLIVISTVQEKMYAQLSKIAPTVMVKLDALSWKDNIISLGNLFNKEDAANKWIKQYEAKAKAAGDKIKKEYGKKVHIFRF